MEHRRSPRTRTILQGRVVFNNRFSLIECTVRDLSDTGAQITFSHPVSLPSELELEIPKKGLSTRAKVMWSNGIHHGLMFLEAAQDEAPDSSPSPYETMAPDKHSPQEDEVDGPALTIQDVLEEARSRIAHIAGVPAEMAEAGNRLLSEFSPCVVAASEALLGQTFRTVSCNVVHVVETRCCNWLLSTRDRIDDDLLPMTHADLAELLGVQRSTVSTVLRMFQTQSLITEQRGSIVIADRTGL
jgi:hypothetical protein